MALQQAEDHAAEHFETGERGRPEVITFLDLIQKDDFRNFVSKWIENSIYQPYCFPTTLPKLYRYRSLSSYAIDDVINDKITLTSIGEFNDIFDGAIHQYGNMEEIEVAAEAMRTEMETHRITAHLSDGLLRRDDIVKPYIEYFKTEARLKFRELDYLGTYVCCFSDENSSTLMWAHYADSNKGLCIEYDFNKLPNPKGDLLRNSIFPVAYTSEPIDVKDLLSEMGRQIYQYPLDAAVLCTALNKASMWQYEREWRIVWVPDSDHDKDQRLTIDSLIVPSKLYFGYHFLRPFFYYNYESDFERKKCKEIINKFKELVAYMKKNKIRAAVMTPLIGSYKLTPYDVSPNVLYEFIHQYFRDGQPSSMRFYYTVHDRLMDLLERSEEGTHV